MDSPASLQLAPCRLSSMADGWNDARRMVGFKYPPAKASYNRRDLLLYGELSRIAAAASE